MHKLKELYSSPSSKLLVIRFEVSFLQSGGTGHPGGDEDYNDQGDF